MNMNMIVSKQNNLILLNMQLVFFLLRLLQNLAKIRLKLVHFGYLSVLSNFKPLDLENQSQTTVWLVPASLSYL